MVRIHFTRFSLSGRDHEVDTHSCMVAQKMVQIPSCFFLIHPIKNSFAVSQIHSGKKVLSAHLSSRSNSKLMRPSLDSTHSQG